MLLLALVACTSDKPTDSGPADGPTYTDPDGNSLTVGADGVLRFGEREVTLALGTVTTPDETINYDPWNLVAGDKPSGFKWREVTSASWDGERWQLAMDGWTGTLEVDDRGPGVRLTLTSAEDTWAPYARLTVKVTEDEAFYGLGEWFDGVEHRGHVHPMQIIPDPTLESGYNEAHVPVPILISTAGWGVLADSTFPGVFDVAAADPGAVQVMFNQIDGISFDLYGATPREALARYHQRTGYPEVPPDWAFAPLQWRDESTAAEVLADAEAIRANGIPGGCVWIDNPWQTTYNSMQPDEGGRFPEWDAMIATLEAKGFRMLTWTTPYVEEADPEYATYEGNGWFVDIPILFNHFGPLVDLTNPDAAAAWGERVAGAHARGVHGWKLDYGEDVQIGLYEARLQTTFANGQDERTMHHAFVKDYHRVYAGDDGEKFLLGRAGVLGGHTITDAIWPGDLDSDFRVFGEDGHVGGLPSAVRGGTGLAMSGYPFYASDTGGYRHDRPTEEVFLRWTEYAALLPIFQYGGSGADHNPWNFTPDGESVFTEETLAAFRRYAVLHTRLFPYFKVLADRAATSGQPVVMAQGFAYPEEGYHPENAFLVGDDLLVKVIEETVRETTVVLPPGAWVHWWTGQRFEAGEATIDAPLGEGPLFQREGSAIPLLRPEIMTLAATDGTVESWADDPGVLHTRIVPGEGAGFTLPDGEALAWSGDAATLTDGARYTGWDLEIWATGVTGVTWDGTALPEGAPGCEQCWYAEESWVYARVPSGGVVAISR
jgi:alpha-D-xyloside xylohydrolase